MARDRLDRKEIKEDQIHDALFHLADWIYRRRKGITGLIVVLVAGGMAIGGWFYLQAETRKTQSMAFFSAEKVLIDPEVKEEEREDKAIKAMEGFLAEYPDSPQAPTALMHLARMRLDKGEKDAAGEALKKASESDNAPPMVRELARLGMAKLAENAGELDKAESLYTALSDTLMADAKAMGLGRIALARKQIDGARQQFESVAQKATPSPLAQWARQNLDYFPAPKKAE